MTTKDSSDDSRVTGPVIVAQEYLDLAYEAVVLEERFGRVGLYKTLHAMNKVTETLGWEIAAKTSKRESTK